MTLAMMTKVKVAQRGVNGTKDIILQMLEGLDLEENSSIWLVDLLPSRQVEIQTAGSCIIPRPQGFRVQGLVKVLVL